VSQSRPTCAAEHQRVAEAVEPGVGADARDDEPVLGQVERDRLGGRDPERERVDRGDFHGAHPLKR
jgi:hypothetical protein